MHMLIYLFCCLECVNQILLDNLPHLGINRIHLLYPGHLVGGFQLLGDAGGVRHLLHQRGVPLGGGTVDLFQVRSQLA